MNEERFLKAYQEVQVLIDTFEENESIYKDTSKYSEAEVRTDYIDKFYIALGWDVRHEQQTNPFEQEVKVEVSQRQEGESGSKRADYAFYLAPNYKQPQFFVEAKQPSKALKNNKDFYFQTAKYGWNAGTGVSILTDFEEIVVINCILKPNYEEILKCKLLSFQYKDFRDKEVFRKFYDIFSHDAVQEGKLRDYVKGITNGDINETVSIDNTFLKYIEEKRLEMAQAIHAKNPDYDSYELTEATQKVIDRLVFMRFLEDKNIESENILYTISTDKDPWDRMMKRSAELDSKYNGIVFKPSILEDAKFKGVDIEKFRAIAQDLDHKHTPFDFNYIPIHILGTIYERFLGNIIVIEQGDIDIQMKPEVRKAGGVFYTPQYIVDYIVQNTIGKLIEGKKPEDIAQLRFADIACGSGSFLIGAYEYLLDYHTKYYNDKVAPKVAEKAGCILDPKTNKYVLSIKQKQDILKNNIYGVDIDHQATEVTQMSLFLKLLEDETMATANQMQTLFKEKILPDMSENIKCGNSLIGLDVVPNVLELSEDESRTLNPFDFRDEFEDVFNNGGFDAIIGNPPYVRNAMIESRSAAYYHDNYSVVTGQYDLYEIFIERSIDFLKYTGYFGYITPRFYQFNINSLAVREMLLSNGLFRITEAGKAFKDANTECSIMFLSKSNQNRKLDIYNYYPNEELTKIRTVDYKFFETLYSKMFNSVMSTEQKAIIDIIRKDTINIEDCCYIRRGLEVGKTKVKAETTGTPILLGYDTSRYCINYDNTVHELTEVEKARLQEFDSIEKLLIRRVTSTLEATLDKNNYAFIKNLYGLKSNTYNLSFILGLLNSKLLNWYFKVYFTTKKDDIFPEIQSYQIKLLPIPVINEKNKHLHDEIVDLVNQMLDAKVKETTAVSGTSKTMAQRVINSLERNINSKVYEIYGLSEEEIAIIE